MKSIILTLLSIILLIACQQDKIEENGINIYETNQNRPSTTIQNTIDSTYSSIDFMQLLESDLQQTFFEQLDSMISVQHPNNDLKSEIFVDLTPKLLNQFLNDISQDSLSKNGEFEKEYHFGIAPSEHSDPEKCKDKITVTFNPKYSKFRLEIYNTFLVESDWCTESMVVYAFEIKDGKIIDFWRNMVG